MVLIAINFLILTNSLQKRNFCPFLITCCVRESHPAFFYVFVQWAEEEAKEEAGQQLSLIRGLVRNLKKMMQISPIFQI